MSRTVHVIAAPQAEVFAVLADGWTYSDWVVGTTHIRDVDPSWPEPGSRIHHKAGPWPLSVHGETPVIDCDPPTRLVLRPKLWPFGEATVTFTLIPIGGEATRVVLDEEVTAGPVKWLHNKISDLLLHGRNREGLRRLADFAKHRANSQ
ncbi:MAG: SRPBCC family protein [Longispora sp.]|nr:SRPBCC family protein [Longispora sp. (in: high G+C Gram-positive bacteria)]